MNNEYIYDIADVCQKLNITSRTLRFYEEKGIIDSTKDGFSNRRKYTKQQIDNISKVVTLRALGLSIKAIQELKNNGVNLKDEIISRRAEVYARIDKHIREIDRLNEALALIDSGNNLFEAKSEEILSVSDVELNTVNVCSDAIARGDTDTLYEYLSDKLKEYMPKDVFCTIRNDTLKPLGDFVCFGEAEPDPIHTNKVYKYVKYSKLGLKITFIFYGKKIDGMWLSYYEL